MDNQFSSRTGKPIAGKAYVLRTTEGEELLSPEDLFHGDADAGLGDLLRSLAERVRTLEEAAADRTWPEPAPEEPQGAEEPPPEAGQDAPRVPVPSDAVTPAKLAAAATTKRKGK
ncbi:hypothetical protein [Streptomyces sp. NBC_00470]|uniref:hypothetical protein n=1 Tax=Streptomyces sp. NBC_00470 TaxID=2975753 RepID=UPI0030E451F3